MFQNSLDVAVHPALHSQKKFNLADILLWYSCSYANYIFYVECTIYTYKHNTEEIYIRHMNIRFKNELKIHFYVASYYDFMQLCKRILLIVNIK